MLLDLNLPKKDGREVLAEIKTDAGLKRIPVVILTTSKAEEDILKTYNLHANCYITKPIDLNQFIKVVLAIEEFWFTIVKLPPNGAKNERNTSNPHRRGQPADTDFIQELLPVTGPVSFQVESVVRLSEALTRLERKGIDPRLAGPRLARQPGLQTFHKLREAVPGVPVVVLTGTNDHEMAVRAVRDGAQDYLVKGQVQGHLLVLAARYALERKRTGMRCDSRQRNCARGTRNSRASTAPAWAASCA